MNLFIERKTANRQNRPGYFMVLFAFLAGLAMIFLFMQSVNANAAAIQQDGALPDLKIIVEEGLQATDLQIKVSASPQTVRPGGFITFTIRYTNTRTSAINNINIHSTLSTLQIFDGVYVSSPNIPTSQFTYSGAPIGGYTLDWTITSMPASSFGTIVIHTQAMTDTEPSYSTDPTLLGNSVAISASGATGGNSNDVAIVVGPLLELSKAASPSSVFPGHLLTYTLTLKNYTRSDSIAATNLVISDAIPGSSTFISIDSGGVYVPASNAVRWEFSGPFLPGSTKTFKFVVLVEDYLESTASIKNDRNDYKVHAAELRAALKGKNNVSTSVNPVLLKTVKAQGGATATVFPRDEVTYTITVHNPISIPLSNVIVTDTLPGLPNPFTYKRPAPGSPTPSVVSGGRYLVWNNISLPAWGSTTFSFVVQIPNNTCVADDKTETSFLNELMATHPSTYFSPERNLASVKVKAPVILTKTVNPNHAMPGEKVTYDITVENRGPYVVNSIRLTDTMEGGFHYVNMVSGPAPLPGYTSNPVVWNNIALGPGQEYHVIFEAEVQGSWLVTYRNNLDADSPEACVPANTGLAGVKVDPPIGLNKVATPDEIFYGETVNYEVQVHNYSDTAWTMDKIEDNLPDGFYQVGGTWSDPAVIEFTPPHQIAANDSWAGTFQANALDVSLCANLPQTFPNDKGALRVHFTSPETIWLYSIVNMAPVTLKPNVEVEIVPYRRVVQPGNLITYTMNLNNVSPYPANNSHIVVTLPAGFTYVGTVMGQPPSLVNGTILTWNGVTILANTEISIIFQATASTSTGTKQATFTGSALDVCFGKLVDGKVTVAEDVIVLKKQALSNLVPPLALVDFDITFDNKDDYDFTLQNVTDTLPTGFTFISMTVGPAPASQSSNQLFWKNILIPGGSTVKWRARLRAPSLYGTGYKNQIAAYCNETVIKSVLSDPVAVQPRVDMKKETAYKHGVDGMTTIYTITLVNLSDITFYNIRVTDTLPGGFTFLQNRPGNIGSQLILPNANHPVWMVPKLNTGCTNGCTISIAFDALVGPGVAPGVYYNQVDATSQSGSIPGPIYTAPITITQLTPAIFFPRINKK